MSLNNSAKADVCPVNVEELGNYLMPITGRYSTPKKVRFRLVRTFPCSFSAALFAGNLSFA